MFKSVTINDLPEDGSLRIQHDYMSAYFDFFTGQADGFKIARRIVQKYEDYPILAWRIPFLEILDQLNEYDGDQFDELDQQDQDEESKSNETLTDEQKRFRKKKAVNKEPTITFEISDTETATIVVDSANVTNFSVKFYIIDAEILFSRTPFLKTSSDEFSYVKPCHVIEKSVEVNPNGDITPSVTKIAIPEHLKLQNMVLEVSASGSKQLFRTYYASQLHVTLTEAYGELKVTEKASGKPLPAVYVKVYSQQSENASDAKFYKDGYTDMRGKFDYAQTSGGANKLREVKKFAILVLSDNLGSIIKECEPPKDGSQPAQSGSAVVSDVSNLA
jgi:hypothetical protein